MAQKSDSLEHVLDDARYLTYEMDALQLVIKDVPIYEKPANSESIFELIAIIDFAQTTYYKPLLEQLFSQAKPDITIQSVQELYKSSANEVASVEELLPQIIANRTSLIDWLSKLPVDSFHEHGFINSVSFSMISLLEDMVQFERKQLRKVADRVLSMDTTSSEQK